MKGKSTIAYLATAAVAVFVLYLLIVPTTPGLVSTFERDVNRFGAGSVDVQLAMGTMPFDPPHMIGQPPPMKPLLLFPPSQTDLEKLSGPVANV
jgi:hypothetical protein